MVGAGAALTANELAYSNFKPRESLFFAKQLFAVKYSPGTYLIEAESQATC
jgi:hypothetical protein